MTKNSYPALLLRLANVGLNADLLADLTNGFYSRRTILRAIDSAAESGQDVTALVDFLKSVKADAKAARHQKRVGDKQRLKAFTQGKRSHCVTVNVATLFDAEEPPSHVDVEWIPGAVVIRRAS